MALTKISGEVLQQPLNVGVVTASQINVGSAVTIHSGGFQIGSSDLHSTGLTVQNLNSTGIITAASFSGDGSNLTGLTRTLTIGVRTGAALTTNLTGSSFNVIGRSGNVTINI
jgi:hypothetical protein